jgi:hypothetical protein
MGECSTHELKVICYEAMHPTSVTFTVSTLYHLTLPAPQKKGKKILSNPYTPRSFCSPTNSGGLSPPTMAAFLRQRTATGLLEPPYISTRGVPSAPWQLGRRCSHADGSQTPRRSNLGAHRVHPRRPIPMAARSYSIPTCGGDGRVGDLSTMRCLRQPSMAQWPCSSHHNQSSIPVFTSTRSTREANPDRKI